MVGVYSYILGTNFSSFKTNKIIVSNKNLESGTRFELIYKPPI